MTSDDLERNAFSIGWLASLGLHAALAFVALTVAQRVTFVPHIPFTWQVAMVASSSNRADPSAALSGNPETSRQNLYARAPVPSTSSDTRQMPRAVRPTAPVATGSPIVPTSTPVEPAEEPIPQTTFKAETAAASRLDNRQAEWPSEPDSIRLPVPPQAIQQQSEGLSPTLTPSGGPKVTSATRPNYTWLFETILRRMEEVKKYPTEARLNQAQGKVVLKAIIRSDGSVEDVEIAQSSGHQTLDEAAVELLKVAGPFELPRPLEKPQLTVKIPMSYRLQ